MQERPGAVTREPLMTCAVRVLVQKSEAMPPFSQSP